MTHRKRKRSGGKKTRMTVTRTASTRRRRPGALRKRAEKHAKLNARKFTGPYKSSAVLAHELHVHQIELEMQNEELRRAQRESDDARKKYRGLYDLAPVGYFTLDGGGFIHDLNLRGAELLGLERANLKNKVFTAFVRVDVRREFISFLNAVFTKTEIQKCEFPFQRRNGTMFYGLLEAQEVPDRKTCRLVLTDVTLQREAVDWLTSLLREKEILMEEVNHRVKNNLQLVLSLLNLQAGRVKEPETRHILKQSSGRIRAMALLLEKIYSTKDLRRIDMAGYLGGLVAMVFSSHPGSAGGVHWDLDVDRIWLEIDKALPCGMIVHELLSNSLEHAFPEKNTGEVFLSLKQETHGLILTIKDDGVGLRANLDYRTATSLGFRLVCSLTEQLGGQIEQKKNGRGTGFQITFSPSVPVADPVLVGQNRPHSTDATSIPSPLRREGKGEGGN